MTGPTVCGEPAIDRLMRQVAQEMRIHDCAEPSREQVAVVLHALADHTAIQAAMQWRIDPHSPWMAATSLGRWFHDVADQAERTES